MAHRVAIDDERLKGRRCGIDNCPSKRYFRVDGRIVCDRGHEQNFLEIAEDEEAPVSTSVKRHRINEGGIEGEERQRKRREVLKPLSAEANVLLYLQCYQFVLHGQIKSLIHLGLPPELEGVVVDLWGLYVTALNVKLIERENEKRSKPEDDDEFEGYSSLASDDSTVESSSDEASTSATTSSRRKKAYRSDVQELKKYPPLLISPLFSYLGILILRLPVTLVDLFTWIKSEKIPYIRAVKIIPTQMFKRLRGHTHTRFTINTKLEPKLLHYWTRRLMEFYLQEFKLTFPPLNHPPIMWKFAVAMSFPPEIYSIARKLANVLEIKEFGHIPEVRGGGYPDAKLMALLIVACRLGYNLEKTRSWKDWATETEEEHGIGKGTAFDDVGEDEILGMSDEQLDGYMDWVQSKWVDEDLELAGTRRITDSILAMFPLDKVAGPSPSATEATTISSHIFMLPPPSNGPHTEIYTIYRKSAVTPTVLRQMIQRGAAVIGVGDDNLSFSIRWIELKLNKCKSNVQRSAGSLDD